MGILEDCIERLMDKPWQSATELARWLKIAPSNVSSVLYRNCLRPPPLIEGLFSYRHRLVKRTKNYKGTWTYAVYWEKEKYP